MIVDDNIIFIVRYLARVRFAKRVHVIFVYFTLNEYAIVTLNQREREITADIFI